VLLAVYLHLIVTFTLRVYSLQEPTNTTSYNTNTYFSNFGRIL